MMKVWILERFVSAEEMVKTCSDIKEMNEQLKEQITDKVEIAKLDKMLSDWEKKMEENPNGYWSGIEGKQIYKQFCDRAKDTIRRNPCWKFRIIEGEVKDDAKYWLDYKAVKINEGVLRYLMATK